MSRQQHVRAVAADHRLRVLVVDVDRHQALGRAAPRARPVAAEQHDPAAGAEPVDQQPGRGLGRGDDVVRLRRHPQLAQVLGDAPGRPRGVVGDEGHRASRTPRIAARCSGAPGTAVTADVDDAVEVQHGQVVRRRTGGPRTRRARLPPRGSGVAAPYDAPMDSSPVVTPPYVARPLRLRPFRGLMLAPGRIGDPASARAFARPYRDVAARLTSWEERGQRAPRRRAARSTCTSTPPAGSPSAGLVGALDLSHRADPRRGPRRPPARGHPPGAGRRARRPDGRDADEPGADPARSTAGRRPDATSSHALLDTPAGAGVHRPGRTAAPALGDHATPSDLAALDDALAGTRALIADGHHRYAAYLRLQQRHPGGPHDRGLAMLVDQDDTPLFLGAIHRVLVGPTPGPTCAPPRRRRRDRRGCGEAAGARRAGARTPWSPPTAPSWATLRLELAPDRAAVAGAARRRWSRRCRGRPERIGYHHSVEDALTRARRSSGVAVLMPAPDFDLVLRIVAGRRLLPEKATSFQPKPSLGVLIRSLRDE